MSKMDEVAQLVKDLDLDVLSILEFDIMDYVPHNSFNIPGYEQYFTAGKSGKTRTISLVKATTFDNIELLSRASGRPETWLKLKKKGHKDLILVSYYREWNGQQLEDLEHFVDQVKGLEATSRVIIIGDFNLDFDKAESSASYIHKAKANYLMENLSEAGFTHFGAGNTFKRFKEGHLVESALDWVFCNNDIITLQKHDIGFSDHSCIHFSLAISKNRTSVYKWVRPMAKIGSMEMISHLRQVPWGDLFHLDIDSFAVTFKQHILDALDKFAPKRRQNITLVSSCKPSQHLKDLRRKRDEAKHMIPTNGAAEYTSLRNKAKKRARQERISKYIRDIETGKSDLWQTIRNVQKSPHSTTKIQDGNELVTGKAAANLINNYFIQKVLDIQDSLQGNENQALELTRNYVNNANISGTVFDLRTVKVAEVEKLLANMKGSKALDKDGLSPWIFKRLASVIVVPLTELINRSIVEGKVPKDWKCTKVTPLFKRGSKLEPKNYRPISIVKVPSKILESVVKMQMQAMAEERNIFPNCSYAYRKGHSTTRAVAKVLQLIDSAKMQKEKVGLILFDLSSAFDTVDASILSKKLKQFNIGKRTIKWINSYLTDRSQFVSLDGEESNLIQVNTGIPQGSCLSPLLFLLMTADLGEAIQSGYPMIYADDTSAVVSGSSWEEVGQKFSAVGEEISRYMANNNMKLNPAKTEFLTFGRDKNMTVTIEGKTISESMSVRLLGININKRLSWSGHVDSLAPELAKIIGALRHLSFYLPKKTLCSLLRPFFISKATYGLELLCNPMNKSDMTINRLQVMLNKAMRTVLKKSRMDHIRIEDLQAWSKCPSIREIAIEKLASVTFEICHPDGSWNELKVKQYSESSYETRSQTLGKVKIGRGNSIGHLSSQIWNKLSDNANDGKSMTRKQLQSALKNIL